MQYIRIDKMKKSLVRSLLKLFPDARFTYENDLRLIQKDHPGYSEEQQYEELVQRYTWKKKCDTHNSKIEPPK
jgi:hypothetical protein